ncbi:TPA: hypothetical protein M2P59_004850 [Klebsiella variicola]|uniref:hypothetical protein n=1 Tax=Klebsiella sp. HMSC25G12 TaxID=1581064 RepID=UPI00114CD762|nr:hypothetical protein [Klebsiella sp. HMSC25G12]HDK6068837.1 hypothetical protein [Klebsiella variicola]HDK6599294.1 hypothetical protein [Klebsiella variicola]
MMEIHHCAGDISAISGNHEKINGNNACRRLILRLKITGLITRFRGYPFHSKYDDSNMKKTQHRTGAGFSRAPRPGLLLFA